MLDAAARKIIDPPLNALGQNLAGRGVTADGPPIEFPLCCLSVKLFIFSL